MATQTATRSAECEFEPDSIYRLLSQAESIPKWAPNFADAIESIDGTGYRVTRNGESFRLEVVARPSAGAVDYLRAMPGGKRGGAYIRVTPRPLGGSTITMTVPVGPNASESSVGREVEQELAALIKLAQTS